MAYRYVWSLYATGDPSNPPDNSDITNPAYPTGMALVFLDSTEDINPNVQAGIDKAKEVFPPSERWVAWGAMVKPLGKADVEPGPMIVEVGRPKNTPSNKKLLAGTVDESADKAEANDSDSETPDAKVVHVNTVVDEWLTAKVREIAGTVLWVACKEKDRPGFFFQLFCKDEKAMGRCREEIVKDEDIKKLVRAAIEQLFPEILVKTAAA